MSGSDWSNWRAGRRHEGDEALEELEGREDDVGAPDRGGLGKPIEKARVGRSEGGDAGERMKALEREGRAGTTNRFASVPAQEALEAGTVITLDAHGSIDAEPTGPLPREHVEGVELIEQPVGAEVPKHATLNDALEPGPSRRGAREKRTYRVLLSGAIMSTGNNTYWEGSCPRPPSSPRMSFHSAI